MKKSLILSFALLAGIIGSNHAFAAAPNTYTIQAGDTFWKIALSKHVPTTDLLAANPNVDPNKLYPGLVIQLPTYYTVVKGDTLYLIAQKNQITLMSLMQANPNVNPMNLIPGSTLLLPVKPVAQTWEQKADLIISKGESQLGKPYVWGGADPTVGFDCSGFTQYAFSAAGIYLPHSSSMQSEMGTSVSKEDLRKGDLIFLQGTYQEGVSHVAIYLGNNQVLHASTLGGTREVKITSLFGNSYYDEHYWGAKRILN